MSDLLNSFPRNSNKGNSNNNNKKNNHKKKFKINYKRIGVLLVALTVVVGTPITHSKIKSNQYAKQQTIENLKKLSDAQAEQDRIKNNKVIYLTFDDGPNNNTEKVLDILDKNNIRASFFLVGNMAKLHEDIVKKIYDGGHTIANHTYSHKYKYSSIEDFKSDIQKTDEVISEAIGKTYTSEFIRIPGGSMNKKDLKDAIIADDKKVIDWTALTGDSDKNVKTKENIMKNLQTTLGDNQYEVLLIHDIKNITVDTLQDIIDYGKSQGYIFEPLVVDSPVQF